MGAKQSPPRPRGSPPTPKTRVMATSGKRLAVGSPDKGDRPWLCWRFPGRCFPAISAGRHSWKAPASAPGSPAAREGQVEGGRQELELLFPVLGFEKHAQPWLGMWEPQLPSGVTEDKSWKRGEREKALLCAVPGAIAAGMDPCR